MSKLKCLYTSSNFTEKNLDNFIQSLSFFSKDSFLIFTNNKQILKYNFIPDNIDDNYTITQSSNFIENNYIYDYDFIPNNNNSNNLCICSNNNPIRILDNNLNIIKSYTLENKQKEKYLSSNFIKFEQYGLNLYTGKNFLSKIDLIKEKIIYIENNKKYTLLSSFDFNIKYSCYLLGSYSNNILLCDYKTDKIVNIFKQESPVNQIKILNSKNYMVVVGYRNNDYISIFDIRKMNENIYKLNRNGNKTKKFNFVFDDKERFLYSGENNGNIIKYSGFEIFDLENNNNFNSVFNKEYFYFGNGNCCVSSVDIDNENGLLLVSSGERNEKIFEDINDEDKDEINIENKEIEKFNNESIFKLLKL